MRFEMRARRDFNEALGRSADHREHVRVTGCPVWPRPSRRLYACSRNLMTVSVIVKTKSLHRHSDEYV